MIFKCVLICALAAFVTPALGSAIKGHSQAEEQTRALPCPHHPYCDRQQKRLEHVEQREEQQPLVVEQREEQQIQQQKEILTQQKEEAPIKAPLRYEAKPQINLEEQKGGLKFEQQKQQEPERLEQVQQQQVVVQRDQFEGQQQLVEEQRRYEEPLVQPILPLTIVEESRAQVKGAVQAPLGEPEPYAFSYQVDGSSRSESGDTKGVVRGQYTVQGADGASRIVDYVADHNGFRASVNTNEFGTESKSPANVALRTSQPTAEEITLKLEGKTKEELHSGVKGAPLPAKPDNWAVKAPAQLPEEIKGGVKHAPLEAPIKGQRLIHQEELQQEVQAPQEFAPVKSAPLRSPKLVGELKLAPPQTRSGFESATAHRAQYRGAPTYVARPAPAIAVRAQPPPPLVRGPVSRAHLQRERYPPSPVQIGHRRPLYNAEQVVPANPRVSFYSPSSASHFDDEQPSFEQPEV